MSNASMKACATIATSIALGLSLVAPTQALIITGNPIAESSGVVDGTINPFVWNFSGVAPGTGNATLTLHYVRLDTDAAGIEFLTVVVDGVTIGNTSSVSQSCVLGTSATFGAFTSDCDASIDFLFDTATLADGLLNVTVNPTSAVNAFIDTTNGAGFAEIQIEYTAAVPEPTTFALLGLGLAALGMRRRTRSKHH